MWQIDVMNASGTVLTTYTDASPGGIVGDSIQTDTDGNGDCLTAEFTMIPGLTSISGRDYVQISQEGAVTWYGYVTTGVNPDDYTEQTIQCQGAKTLLAQMLIDSFWFEGTVAADGTVDHRQIVYALEALLPSYVTNTISNNASATSGNVAPVTAVNTLFGDVMDAIVSSATDGYTYCWGVGADRTVFIKPIGTTTLDLTGVPAKIIQWQTQNVEQIITAVKFVFSFPSGFFWDDANMMYLTSANWSDPADATGARKTLEYLYEDATLLATYGRHTKIVPLVLADSWIKKLSLSDWAAGYGSFALLSGNVHNEASSTAAADLLASLSDGTTSRYVIATAAGPYIEPQIQQPSPLAGIDLSTLVGFEITLDYTAPGSVGALHWNASPTYNDPVATGDPVNDYIEAESFATLSEGVIRTQLFQRALSGFKVDPSTDPGNGLPVSDVTYVDTLLSVLADGSTTPTFKVYEWTVLTIDTSILDAVGAGYVAAPGSYPSTVMLQTDLGNAPYIKIDKRDGTPVTETVKRVTRLSSTTKGTQVTYALAYDAQREDAIFQRLVARDQAAALSGANIGSGGSLGS